jgi:hypothetical protein
MKSTAKLDRSTKEGHGEDGPVPRVSKGTFIQVGTAAPAIGPETSVNRKTGKDQSGQF